MTKYKYQEGFGQELVDMWLNGNRTYVRTTIRTLKNKAQASFIAAYVTFHLMHSHQEDAPHAGIDFVTFMHPNNQ